MNLLEILGLFIILTQKHSSRHKPEAYVAWINDLNSVIVKKKALRVQLAELPVITSAKTGC